MIRAGFYTLALFLLLGSGLAQAQDTTTLWSLNEGHVRFSAQESTTSVEGEFSDFTTEVTWNPSNIEDSLVQSDITLSSFESEDSSQKEQALSSDWFSVEDFPIAHFGTDKIQHLKENLYESEGSLTIKGITQPVVFSFSFEEKSTEEASLKGTATLKRSIFDLGKNVGANYVGENILVEVDIDLKRSDSSSN